MKGWRWMWVIWPAFLAACLLEILVFAAVDPQDIRGFGYFLDESRNIWYTLAFFAFWAVAALCCAMTLLLSEPVGHAPD